ncbi:uncharacterized protein LOC105780107 isoform X3 [Gossypium raimondii]|uniref:Uncharacterized protein isoform X3 n=1 Tax=Gossypium hirsutum TaxID=3635 RepID=A0ABM2ZVQ1_GOSHI|nr:uncharacterized protein LOC107899604 isoform X3 [Gossypium hirsutum]XP_052485292.1 uncharacterized protein LOC105780107 isoform X3 [Gossypium raimondii]
MAMALSCSCVVPIATNKLPHSSFSPPATLSFPPHKSFNPKPPISSICRSQFDGSGYEESEAVEEPFFPYLVEESDDEDDETESSVDLLLRFLHSMFRKVSKRAKKASRSILPAAMSPQLLMESSYWLHFPFLEHFLRLKLLTESEDKTPAWLRDNTDH